MDKIPFWNARWRRRTGGGFELVGNHLVDEPPEVVAVVRPEGNRWAAEVVSDCCNPDGRTGFKAARDAKTWAAERASEPLLKRLSGVRA